MTAPSLLFDDLSLAQVLDSWRSAANDVRHAWHRYLAADRPSARAATFAARSVLPYWGLLLLFGALEIPLGVLALANPGATLAAIITVSGIWAVAIGVTRVVTAFEVKRLPAEIDRAWSAPTAKAAAANA